MEKYKRRQYFIDKKLQMKYVILTLLLLLIYSILFVIILFVPYMIPVELGSTIEERTTAARMLLALHKSVWPSLGMVIIIMSGISIFITHKIAGPVYRFKKTLAEISAGNLEVKIRLRKNDDLQDLAEDINSVVDELREFVKTLKDDYQTMTICIDQLEQQICDKSINDVSGRELIGKMQNSKENIARALDKYAIQ